MYPFDRRRWSEVEGVTVLVCMVFDDEGCEVVIAVYVEDGNRVK